MALLYVLKRFLEIGRKKKKNNKYATLKRIQSHFPLSFRSNICTKRAKYDLINVRIGFY